VIAAIEPADGLRALGPEAALAAGLCAVLLSDLRPALRARRLAPWIGVAAAAVGLLLAAGGPSGAIGAMLAVDSLTALARLLILGGTAAVLLAGAGERRDGGDHGAWAASVLAIGLGALVTAAASNLVSLWLGLELIALPSYVLAAFRRGDRRAAEAGMKFVLFGGASSALMLYGASHVYGITGHSDFAGIGAVLAQGVELPVAAALCLAGVGIAYKLTLVPFHLYAPDVYQGAPALSVAAASAVPKVAAAAALVRALQLAVPASFVPPPALATTLASLAALGMLVAAFTAVAQRDAKRIVAFSGVGHGATLLLAIACGTRSDAVAVVAFYLLAYVAANTGALVCLSVLEREHGSADLGALAGAMRRRPWVATALCVFLFSLAGVPPLAGFLAKWGVLQQALDGGLAAGGTPGLAWAALAALLATAIAAWAYLLIVRAAVLAPAVGEAAPPPRLPWPAAVVLVACAAATVAAGLWLDGFDVLARSLAP
jgi:NADH-quinone oxidoreductase subunit N